MVSAILGFQGLNLRVTYTALVLVLIGWPIYVGEIIEKGNVKDIIENPLHPYTSDLIESIPTSDISRKVMDIEVGGDPPSLYNLPRGCRYSSRCKHAFELCREKEPALAVVSGGREVACFLHHKVVREETIIQKSD